MLSEHSLLFHWVQMQLRPEGTGHDYRETVPNVLNSVGSYLSAARYSLLFSVLYIHRPPGTPGRYLQNMYISHSENVFDNVEKLFRPSNQEMDGVKM